MVGSGECKFTLKRPVQVVQCRLQIHKKTLPEKRAMTIHGLKRNVVLCNMIQSKIVTGVHSELCWDLHSVEGRNTVPCCYTVARRSVGRRIKVASFYEALAGITRLPRLEQR